MSVELRVTDFSCIKRADLKIHPFTVMIGPQASGKSVLSKLVHFFFGLLVEQFNAIEDLNDLDEFKSRVKQSFKEWFPVEAWGDTKFCIEFWAGDYHVRFTRGQYKDVLSENFRISFSPYFEKQYSDLLATSKSISSSDSSTDYELDAFWRIRDAGVSALKKHLGEDYPDSQLFIPAGRSFFTSVGKTIAAFEQGRVLDPLTMRFGRVFANMRERAVSPRLNAFARRVPWLDPLDVVMGGEIVIQRDKEFLRTEDGRKIPLSSMSSGQQELMPLLMMMRARSGPRRQRQLITIEEPEAHLFPAAQSALVESFAGMLSTSNSTLSLLMTTHSPYVLAKLNNLIKAHQVGTSAEAKHRRVVRVVGSRSWVNERSVGAYALHNGELKIINDTEDGLIDAMYLDGVSGAIAREFNELLGIEVIE